MRICYLDRALLQDFVTILLSLWKFTFLGCSMLFKSAEASQSPTSSHQNSANHGSYMSKSMNTVNLQTSDAGIQLWLIVIIVVIIGLLLVAIALCLVKLHKWKKDHGMYSMWKSQEPSVEAMIAREPGTLLESFDVETEYEEAQCYEIPVDSYERPQRIYIEGKRVTLASEGAQCPQSETSPLYTIVDETPVVDQAGCSSVNTTERISQNSSTDQDFNENSNMSDDVFDNPSQNEAEVYPKPLPLPPVDPPKVDLPTPVLCETYTLDVTPREKCFNNLVNRPLPQTPKNAFP